MATTKSFSTLFSALATLLHNTSISSEGGALVLQRTAVDLGWLAGKLKNEEYISHMSPHARLKLLKSLKDLSKAADELGQSFSS